jgi:hypothetical protein
MDCEVIQQFLPSAVQNGYSKLLTIVTTNKKVLKVLSTLRTINIIQFPLNAGNKTNNYLIKPSLIIYSAT